MSDGDGKDKLLSEKENQQERKKKKSRTDEFAQAIARIAVAQVFESVGFESFHHSALNALADVAVRYIREIGKTASSFANLANRRECNVFDVIRGLEELGSAQGFSGASDVRHSLSGSGVVKDIISFVGQEEGVPFVYSIPVFPVVKERALGNSFAQVGETPPEDHIPSWLPKFPDPGTYADLSSGNERESEAGVVNKIQKFEEQNRKGERSVLNLPQRLICNGSEAGGIEQGDAARAQEAAESNPYLAPPLLSWEKEVSLPFFPARLLDETLGYHQSYGVMESHLSTLEPSLLTNEPGGSSPCEPEEKRKILLNGRRTVHFQLLNAKKSLGMVKSPRSGGIEKGSLWFGDDHKGEDEKRTKKIHWEDTEYPPEASHM